MLKILPHRFPMYKQDPPVGLYRSTGSETAESRGGFLFAEEDGKSIDMAYP